MNNLWIYYPDGHEKHQLSNHPERPERIEAIKKALIENNFWEPSRLVEPVSLYLSDLENLHSKQYLEEFSKTAGKSGNIDQDTYYTPDSFQLAINSAGGAVSIAKKVQNEGGVGLALSRPPGHHATRNFAMGFCLLNNIAIAADHLARDSVNQPVAIIDIDLHHGNGTQDIFWQQGDVYYISIHQYPFYPGTGAWNEFGEGAGRNTNLNIPIPEHSGDTALLEITRKIILPYLDKAKPKTLLISLGFDAHWKDPLGSLSYSEYGYYEFFKLVSQWVEKEKLPGFSLYLEGGYSLDASAHCAVASVAGALGLQYESKSGFAPDEDTASWKNILETIQSYWNL